MIHGLWPRPLAGLIFVAIVIFVVRVVPVLRHGRKVVLDRPKPCSMRDAQHALDRLIGAGFDAEIVEDSDNGMNMWANATVAGEVKPDERYVIQVPRKQAKRRTKSDRRPVRLRSCGSSG